jgi:hypothetical protein
MVKPVVDFMQNYAPTPNRIYDLYQYYLGGGKSGVPNVNQPPPGQTGIFSGGQGGGGGFNPYNPNMNQIRTDFKPSYDLRAFQDFGVINPNQLSTAQRKEMDMYPEYYGVNTGVPKTGIPAAFNKVLNNPLTQAVGFALNPLFGAVKGIAKGIGSMLPINQRAIMENQARGMGVLTDDIGRIVAGPKGYNTPEGIMAGYNLSQMTDKTFDKRSDKISETLGEKYGISKSDIQGIMDGTVTEEDIEDKYGVTTNLIGNLKNINLAKINFNKVKTKTQKIKELKEKQKRQRETAKVQARVNRNEDKINQGAEKGTKTGTVNPHSNYGKSKGYTGGTHNPHTDTGWSGSSKNGGGKNGKDDGGEGGYGGFCFDPNTLVQMANGSEKKIKNIKLGDNTKGGEVTGVFQFKASDEIHDYKGVTVAGSHYVKEDGKFIMVQDSPLSVKIDKIPVVYSLDTTGRRIFIKDIEFADYNGDGVAKGFLANAGINVPEFNKEVLRQVEQRLI